MSAYSSLCRGVVDIAECISHRRKSQFKAMAFRLFRKVLQGFRLRSVTSPMPEGSKGALSGDKEIAPRQGLFTRVALKCLSELFHPIPVSAV